MQREKSVTVDEEEVDEEKFRNMIELEERLVEERIESETEADSTVEAEDDAMEEDDDSESAAGVVRSVEEERGKIRIEFFVDGDVETDTIPMPDDPADPDATLNRLCDLCGVEHGRVTELQGERVPLVTDWHDDYEIHVPSETNPVSLAVYRVWWWVQRQGFDLQYARYAVISVVGLGLYAVGMRSLLMLGRMPTDAPIGMLPGKVLPFVTTATFTSGIVGAIAGLILGLIQMLIGFLAAVVTVVLPAALLLIGGERALEFIDDRINPF